MKNVIKSNTLSWGILPKVVGWLLLAALLVGFPVFSSEYILSVINIALINIIVVSGLNLLTGFTGLVSMGSAAFLGFGGFAAGIASMQFGFPFIVTIIVSGLISMVIGVIIGIPSLRLKGLYLLLATLALHFIAVYALGQYIHITQMFSGIRFPSIEIAGFVFDTQFKSYYLMLIITVLVVLFIRNILRTALGRSFVAVRDNEVAAIAMGVNTVRAKLFAFAISSFLIGLAGGLMGYTLRNLTSEMFTLNLAIDHIVALFLGGQATLLGPILGATFITLFPNILELIMEGTQSSFPLLANFLVNYEAEIVMFIYGLSIVLILLFKPTGMAGIIHDTVKRLKKLYTKRTSHDKQATLKNVKESRAEGR